MVPSADRTRRGQVLVLFCLSLVAMLLAAGLVVDGGYAYSQSRRVQNAADFAAMAGTRIVGEARVGNTTAGTAANVLDAVQVVLTANNAELSNAQYVDASGNALGDVLSLGSSPGATIPAQAFGIVVNARANWHPFFLGIIGVADWSASSTATALTPGTSIGSSVLPVGLESGTYADLAQCPAGDLTFCIDSLTSGQLNIPGGFAWLKFGCEGYGLGQEPPLSDGGCRDNQPFLDSEIGPPPNSYGCCGPVGLAGSPDLIGSLTGNEWGNLTYYVENAVPVWVPIWDWEQTGGTGSGGYYHIVGYGLVIFTGDDDHAKTLDGAAIEDVGCGSGASQVEGYDGTVCTAPTPITINATGAVRLIH